MNRRPDWNAALRGYIDGCRAKPFVWGRFDCALFAADAVRAMTGANIAADLRGRYTSARTAAARSRRSASPAW